MNKDIEADSGRRQFSIDGERVLFLHVGKTGGSYVKSVLGLGNIGKKASTKSAPVLYAGHNFNLRKALKKFPKRKIAFSVRHPVSLFVSGFNSRLRKGQPRYDVEWNRMEQLAFATFETPNALAEALSADNQQLRTCAEFSMLGIGHVKDCLKFYLHSPLALEASMHRIAYIFRQEHLDEDLRGFISRSELFSSAVDLDLGLSHDKRHENPPSAPTNLSPMARANLESWYATDIAIYEWCLENQQAINNQWLTTSAH
jgi:hypothetical protein